MAESLSYLTDEIVDRGRILGRYEALIYDDVRLEGLANIKFGPTLFNTLL